MNVYIHDIKECFRKYDFFISLVEQTDELCLLAVQMNPRSIRHIKNQTEELCMLAVKQNPDTIEFIRNPSYELYMLAVELNPHNISFVQNQTDEICMVAVKAIPYAIRSIKNPSDEVKWAAIKTDPLVIRQIKDYSEEMLEYALNKEPELVDLVNNPSEELLLKAVILNYSSALKHLPWPRSVLKAAVKNTGSVACYVWQYLDEELMLIAVKHPYKKDPWTCEKPAIYYFKDPPLNVCLAAVETNPYVIKYLKPEMAEQCKQILKI